LKMAADAGHHQAVPLVQREQASSGIAHSLCGHAHAYGGSPPHA
jgi:hypothetical protein